MYLARVTVGSLFTLRVVLSSLSSPRDIDTSSLPPGNVLPSGSQEFARKSVLSAEVLLFSLPIRSVSSYNGCAAQDKGPHGPFQSLNFFLPLVLNDAKRLAVLYGRHSCCSPQVSSFSERRVREMVHRSDMRFWMIGQSPPPFTAAR